MTIVYHTAVTSIDLHDSEYRTTVTPLVLIVTIAIIQLLHEYRHHLGSEYHIAITSIVFIQTVTIVIHTSVTSIDLQHSEYQTTVTL